MQPAIPAVPWTTPAQWQEINRCLEETIQRRQTTMAALRRQALRIRDLLETVFPPMNALCYQVCRNCRDNCCRRAWVWADFRDLLFLHLADIPPPQRQLLIRRGEGCRYAAMDGCRLDRLQRPFICTWYVCPSQMHLLRKKPDQREGLLTTLRAIQQERRRLEDRFIQAVR